MNQPSVERILLATDFSSCSEQALQFAVYLAEAYGAQLDLVHVLELEPGMDQKSEVVRIYLDELQKSAARQFDSLVDQARTRVKSVVCHQIAGIPADQINQVARDRHSELVVVGTHGWSGLQRVLIGSTAERVVRGAPCPVATVRWRTAEGQDRSPREGEGGTPEEAHLGRGVIPRLKHLLVPVDFSDCSLEAFDYAVQMAQFFGASVTLLHVLEPFAYGIDFTLIHPSKAKKSRETWEGRLTELASILRSRGISARHELRGGLPSDVILDRIRAFGPDLVVMGTHGRRGFSHLYTGSVAEAVLRQSPCPVLTMKSAKLQKGDSPGPSGKAA